MSCKSGSTNNWWLRSPNLNNTNNVRNVNNNGNLSNNNANNNNGLAFGLYQQPNSWHILIEGTNGIVQKQTHRKASVSFLYRRENEYRKICKRNRYEVE